MDYQRDYMDRMAYKTGQRKQYDGANVKFEYVEVPDKEATTEKGMPQFKLEERIVVQFPGGDTRVCEVTDRHIQEYGHLYDAFKAGDEQPENGYPLTMWPPIDKASVKNLAQFKIHTVEQLAGINGTVRKRIGTLEKWVKIAKDFLENADTAQAEVSKLKGQLTKSKTKIKNLEEQLHLALQRIEALEGTNLTGE